MKSIDTPQTPPLSPHEEAELAALLNKPCPREAMHPHIASQLVRKALVESVLLPSPFKTHAGKPLEHLQITEAGRLAAGLVESVQPDPRVRIEIASSPTHPDRWRWAVVVYPRHIFAMSEAFSSPEDCAVDAATVGVKALCLAQAQAGESNHS